MLVQVVQLYVTLPNTSSVPVAKLQLSSFARLHIPRGQVATVSFTVVPEDHSVLRNNSDFAAVIEPGVRRIWVRDVFHSVTDVPCSSDATDSECKVE